MILVDDSGHNENNRDDLLTSQIEFGHLFSTGLTVRPVGAVETRSTQDKHARFRYCPLLSFKNHSPCFRFMWNLCRLDMVRVNYDILIDGQVYARERD